MIGVLIIAGSLMLLFVLAVFGLSEYVLNSAIRRRERQLHKRNGKIYGVRIVEKGKK